MRRQGLPSTTTLLAGRPRPAGHYESEFGVWLHDSVSAAEDAKGEARFLRAFDELPNEEAMRADFADGMLWSIAGKVNVDLEEPNLPTVPPDAGLAKLEWTAGRFRACLATIFEQADRDEAEFMRTYSVDAAIRRSAPQCRRSG